MGLRVRAKRRGVSCVLETVEDSFSSERAKRREAVDAVFPLSISQRLD